MDLMNLVAKLTLDPKAYEQALKKAESEGKKFKGDATGILTAIDNYTDTVEEAEAAAKGFKGNAEGKLKADDKFTPVVGTAETKGEAFDGTEYDAELTANDSTDEGILIAKDSVGEFTDGEYDAELEANDSTAEGVQTAEDSVSEFDGKEYSATLKAEDDTTETVETANTAVKSFDGKEYTADLKANDETSAGVNAAEAAGEAFDGKEYDAALGAEDSFSDTVASAKTEGDDFDGTVYEADLDADDGFSDVVGDAEAAGETFDGNEYEADVNGDASDFNTALDEAEEHADTFIGNIQSKFEAVGNFLQGSVLVSAIKKISSVMLGASMDTAAYMDRVQKSSERMTGISMQSFQEWDWAMSQSGASIESLERRWGDFTDAINRSHNDPAEWAANMSDFGKALAAIGINPKNFETAGDLLDETINKLASMEDNEGRAELVNALFGDMQGKQLNDLLNQGVDGIAALKAEAHSLGRVFSDEDIENGVKFGDSIASMQESLNALKMTLAEMIIPALTSAADWITGLVTSVTEAINGTDTLAGKFANFDEEMQKQVNTADSDEKAVKGLLDYMNSLMTDTGVAAENMGAWEAAAQKVKDLCPELAPLISSNADEWKKNADEIERTTKAYFNNARAQAVSMATEKKQQALAEQAARIAEKEVDIIEAKSRTGYDEKTAKIADLYTRMMASGAYADNAYSSRLSELGLSGDTSTWTATDYSRALTAMEAARMANGRNKSQFTQEVYALTNGGAIGDINSIAAMEGQVGALSKELEESTKQYEAYRDAADQYIKTLQSDLNALPTEVNVDVNVNGGAGLVSSIDGTGAKGINYVPYDGYIAKLHRGEAVLNQGQSRYYESSAIDTNAIAAAVSSAISESLKDVSVNMDGRAVGDLVTNQVAKNIAAQMQSGRYT